MVAITIYAGIAGYGSAPLVAMQWVFVGLMIGWLIFGTVLHAILKTFPAKCSLISTSSDTLNSEAFGLQAELARQGFSTISRPMLLNLNPPMALLAMKEDNGRCFATIFNSGSPKNKPGTDFVSVIQNPRDVSTIQAILTTGNMAEGGTVPVPKGSFMQLFPGADLHTLLQRHIEAMQFLQKNGVNFQVVNNQAFRPALFSAIGRIKTTFLRDPVVNTLVAMFRTFSKRSPWLGPISSQRSVQRQFGNDRPGYSGIR